MAARPVLMVVVIADAALRSTVARRLAMQGAELLSASGWSEALFLGPMIRPQSVLVIDDSAGDHSSAIERQRREGLWRRVVMLTTGAFAANDRDGVTQADRCSAAALLATVFANGTCAAAA
jgi:hypothetical protein